MIPTQPSPVATRRRVRMALPKFSKLACLFIVSCGLTSANNDTPRTEKRNKNRSSSRPTLTSSGIARMNVWKIYCKFFAVLISLSTRAILNDLMIVEILPTSTLNTCKRRIPIHAESTMMKSKRHQPSLKYPLPYAVILITISMV